MLTAFAESRFKVDARQQMNDGIHYTVGIFQQSDMWWPGDLSDPKHATDLFLDAFPSVPGGLPVLDCWYIQQWSAPNPANYSAFLAAPETQNYVNCLPFVQGMIDSRKVYLGV